MADLREQLNSERSTITQLRSEISHLSASLEAANTASFEAQRRLASEQSAIQREREAALETETFNEELRQRLADSEAIIAEKETVIAQQHRDIVKMRNHSAQVTCGSVTHAQLEVVVVCRSVLCSCSLYNIGCILVVYSNFYVINLMM